MSADVPGPVVIVEVVQDLDAARREWRDVASRLHHHPLSSAPETPGGDMTLATIEALGSSIESAASWLKQGTEEHLPAIKAEVAAAEARAQAAEAELERLQAHPVVQEVEALAAAGTPLLPPEAAMIAHVIAGLPALRGAQNALAASSEPAQPTTPADVPPPADVTPEPAAQPA